MTPHEEGQLTAAIDHLTEAVKTLTKKVERLENQASYWSGAIWMLVLVSAAIGFGVEASIQWFHK